MDAAQWPQVGLARSMEEIALMAPPNTTNSSARPPPPPPQQQQFHHQQQQQQQQGVSSDPQRRGTAATAAAAARPQKEQNVNCPRCNSTNTKFCYYNNYSLTQPRYFCKTCRRYWTQGGSLRNVPVGGGSRKNKRSASQSFTSSTTATPTTTSSSSSPSSSMAMLSELNPTLGPSLSNLINMSNPHHHLHHQNPNKMIHPHSHPHPHPHPHHLHGHDLNLTFSSTTTPPNPQDYTLFQQHIAEFPNTKGGGITIDHQNNKSAKVELTNNSPSANSGTSNCSASSTSISTSGGPPLSALELLRTGMASTGLNSFIPMTMSLQESNNQMYVSGFPGLQEFKPDLMMGFHHHHHHHHNSVANAQGEDRIGGGGTPNNNIRFSEHEHQDNGTDDGSARLLFPFGDINSKLAGNSGGAGNTSINEVVQKSGQQQQGSSHGYWINSMLGGGGGGGGGGGTSW